MMSRRTHLGLAAVGDYLYAVGGRRDRKTLSSVECFDTRSNSWHHCSKMIHARHSFCISAVGQYLYVLGGENDAILSSIERYDTLTDKWELYGDMPQPRTDFGLVKLSIK